MRWRSIAAGLALSAVFASACAGSEEGTTVETTPTADANLSLTTRWWFLVSGATSTTDIGNAATTSEKDAILARIRQLKATHCPGSSECRVALQALVCAPSLGGQYCDTSRIAGHIGWRATVDALATFQRDQIAFLEQRNVPARWVEQTLTNQRSYQSTVLGLISEVGDAVDEQRSRIVNQTRSRLNAMAIEVRGEENARLANVRWAVTELAAAADAYEASLPRVRPLYADVAQRFTAYRESETSAIGALQTIATAAGTAALPDMAGLKTQVAAISGDENRIPQQLILDAERVRWELAQIQAEYDRLVEPHGDVLESEGLTRLDHTSVPREGMGKVVHYAEQRIDRVNAAVTEILDGIARREEALVLVAAESATRDAARAAAGAHAEATFLNDITARITELWRTPPTSTRLRMPFLGERVRSMEAFLQLEKLCAGGMSLASWRAPGCTRIANELTKVRRYLTQTLPFTIRFGITKLRTNGVSAEELAAIEAELVAGHAMTAAVRYDIAIRAVEED